MSSASKLPKSCSSILQSLALDPEVYMSYILPLLESLSESPMGPDEVDQIEEVVDLLVASTEIELPDPDAYTSSILAQISKALDDERTRLASTKAAEVKVKDDERKARIEEEINQVADSVSGMSAVQELTEEEKERKR